jgi:glycosyltransferase involved in cell wall biosynthesis
MSFLDSNSKLATQNSKLRVAVDARMVHYRRAGIGQYVINLLHALSRSPDVGTGARVQVLQMRGHEERLVNDRRFKRMPMWTPPHNRFEQPALGVELLKLRPQPQLIHCPDFVPPFYRRFPAVVNIQDLAFLKFPEMTLLTEESKRYYGQVHRAAHNAEALIALSQSARDDIVDLLGVSPEKVTVIYGAVSEDYTPAADWKQAQQAAAKEFGLPAPEDGGYILFLGTIEPRKNLPVLLEAYRLLLDRNPSPLPTLAIAGRKGWVYEKVYALIENLKLTSEVRLLGEVPGESVVRLYQGARVFAMPSLYEGFGLPALEAMACGVPVVASTGGSLPEVVGEAGILLDPHDVEGWAVALQRLLFDQEEAERLRIEGLNRAATFSWEKAAAQTWQLYKRVASYSPQGAQLPQVSVD